MVSQAYNRFKRGLKRVS